MVGSRGPFGGAALMLMAARCPFAGGRKRFVWWRGQREVRLVAAATAPFCGCKNPGERPSIHTRHGGGAGLAERSEHPGPLRPAELDGPLAESGLGSGLGVSKSLPQAIPLRPAPLFFAERTEAEP